MTSSPPAAFFKTIGIIGVGLIGGSLGLAFKQAGLTHRVLGFGRSEQNLQVALKQGQIDAIVDLASLTQESDCIIICVPVAQIKDILRALLPDLRTDTLIMDVGSTKMDVIAGAQGILGQRLRQFIPCHPIAGGAQHGAIAARRDLFANKQIILCPLEDHRSEDLARITACWEQVGAQVFSMPAKEHDQIFAAVSHLPHLLSYALMLQIANASDADKKFRHAGAGFRDFTRIAGSSPEMWKDIALANREAILLELEAYLQEVERLKQAIHDQDADTLYELLSRASQSRNQWQG